MEQRLAFPLQGLSEAVSEGDQPQLTSRDCANVRDFDARTGRLRGAQRAGLDQFSSGPAHRNYLSQTNDFSASSWVSLNGLSLVDVGGGEFNVTGENDGANVSSLYQDVPASVADWQVSRTLTFSCEVDRSTAFSTRFLASLRIGTAGQGLGEDNVLRVGWNNGPSFTFTQVSPGASYTSTLLDDGFYRLTITLVYNPLVNSNGVRFEVQPENTLGNVGIIKLRNPEIVIGAYAGYSEVPGILDHSRERAFQHATGFSFKDKTIAYANQMPVEDWSTQTASKEDCRGIQVDSFGNVYALDGDSTVVKLNGAGQLVWRTSVPLQEDEGGLGVIYLDEFRSVYLGQNEGDQDLAQLFKYTQRPFDDSVDDPENRTTLEWTIDLVGRVREIERREELLLVLVDNDETLQSAVVAYGGLETANPYQAWARQVPYPSNALSVGPDGGFFTAHEPNTDRGRHGLAPVIDGIEQGGIVESWTPNDLEEAEYGAIYSWFKAEDLLDNYEDGDPVLEWFDTNRRGPALFAPKEGSTGIPDETLAPIFVRNGSGGRPAVRFTGGRYMISGPNGTSQSSGASLAATTLLPVYEDAAFVAVAVIRFLDVTRQGTILAHRSNSRDYAWTHNKRVDGTFNGETFAVWTATDAADGGNSGTSSGGGFGNYPGDAVSAFAFNSYAETVTVVNGGGSGNTGHSSMWRYGGRTIDVWEEDAALDATEAVYLGTDDPLTTKHGSGEYELSEIIVFQKQDPTDIASECLEIPEAFDPDDGSPDTTITDTSLDKIEGYASWRYGFGATITDGSGGFPPHTYRNGCPVAPGAVDPNPLLDTGSLLVKYGAQGSLKWVLSNYNGSGYECIATTGGVYCAGPSSDSRNVNGVPVSLRKVIDNGTLGSVQLADGAWAYNGLLVTDPSTRRAKGDVDSALNFYWPMDDSTARDFTVRILSAEGDVVHDYVSSDVSGDVRNCRQVVASKDTFDYEGDPATLPEFFWAGLEAQAPGGGAAESPQVLRLDQVSNTPNGNSQRGLQVLSVVSGVVSEESPVSRVLTGATLSPTAEYVDSAFINGELVMVDGVGYYVYNPRTSSLGELVPENSGEIPAGFKLAANYRGRLFLANARDDGSAWAASKRGVTRNWDLIPAVPTVDQATASTVSRAGACPDVITSLISYSDDVLIAGGDHSIWMLRGDPEQAGDWDQISDSTGMAFGRAWCKDPSGVLYFFGSRGIVYRMVPGGQPAPISDTAVDKRLRDIDLSLNWIELAWNTEDRGFHLAVIPKSPSGTQVESYFWSERTSGWWPDTFQVDRQPLALLVIDGDEPGDRQVLQVGEDRWIRGWSQAAEDDDGQAIQSRVLIGPVMPPSQDTYRYQGLQCTLADRQGGARASWYLSDRPDFVGDPVFVQELVGGRNARSHQKFRGSYMWLRLDSGDSRAWAFENAFANVYKAGRGRSVR